MGIIGIGRQIFELKGTRASFLQDTGIKSHELVKFTNHAIQGGVERQGIGHHFDGARTAHGETLVR